MEPWIVGLICGSSVVVTIVVIWLLWMLFKPASKGEIHLSAETPRQKELKILYDLGFLCGKHDGRHGDYGRPCYIAPDLDRLHWWNGYHDGLKWREEDDKLNGDFTE